MFIPLLEGMDIAGKTITADALLTQRKLARYVVEQRAAHYLFTAKDNQSTLLADIRLFFKDRDQPHFQEPLTLEHGRLQSRSIWTTSRLNEYLDFPFVGQAFAIERHTIDKKTDKFYFVTLRDTWPLRSSCCFAYAESIDAWRFWWRISICRTTSSTPTSRLGKKWASRVSISAQLNKG